MKYNNILHSFTKIEPLDESNEIITYFFNINDSYQFQLKSIEVNLSNDNISEFDKFIDNIEIKEIKTSSYSQLISEIIILGNQIARETKRSVANHYAILDNNILIWYKGNSGFDTPVQYCKNSVVYHDNAKSYFRRLKFNILNFDIEVFDSALQKARNYKRIII